jgi:ketosteroid isomerase-like protein
MQRRNTMTVESNKKTVLHFIKEMAGGRIDADLLTDDASWWVPGGGDLSRAQFLEIVERFKSLADGPTKMDIVAVTAEEDRVAVEANGRATLKDGRIYANTYHFLFYLRDGKIRHAREHNNSAIPAALFGGSLRTQGAA